MSDLPSAVPGHRFVHLHTHTEHSKQDSIARLDRLVQAAADDGQPAIAMTDHGTIDGAWKFVNACKKAAVKPIIGIEAYMALVPDGSEPGQEQLAWDNPRVRFAKTTRMQPDAESGKVKRNTNNHLTILVRNETGWRNLCRIVNAAEESFYYKALIDYALLKKHSEGLIVLTGCLGGPVASQVAMARTDVRDDAGNLIEVEWDEAALGRARDALNHLIESVGRDNVYVEIMEHDLGAEGRDHIKKLAELAKDAGVRVVATNDSHYVDADDCDAHDSWLVNGELARGNQVRKDDPDRWRFNGTGYHLRTTEEMYSRYPNAKTWQAACAETVKVADRIDADVIPHKPLRLPRFDVPADVVAEWEAGEAATFTDFNKVEHPARKVKNRIYPSPAAFCLHDLVLRGAVRRWGRGLSETTKARLRFEEDVITGMGLADYFLIVWDAITWARSDRGLPTDEHPLGVPAGKKPMLVGPGRGSSAGSAISYTLDIVMVDPLDNDLLFERFLDVARIGMPDIDVDFEAARRDEVFSYVAARYGDEYVARIGAFQVAKTKRAIKDAARVLEATPLAEDLNRKVPVHQGKPQTFAQLFEEVVDEDGTPVANPEAEDFRALVAADEKAAEVVALARKFEDVVAGASIHAAGVIISDEPLTDLIPMHRKRDKKTGQPTGVPISCWDGKDIESFGMLKLDALSLSNLDVIAAAVANIELTTSEIVNPNLLPDPDSGDEPRVDETYRLLRDGKTEGVFQLESSGMTELCEDIAPTAFADLTALVALYRPGPMAAGTHTLYAKRKNGRAEVDYSIFTSDEHEQQIIAASLDQTFGLAAYQEQLMTLAADVAGFTADEKNQLRRAFSKKDRPAMEALKKTFLDQGQSEMVLDDGREKPAFQRATLESLWVTFDGSAEYLFNKSHAAAYGYIAYVTAFLKANWPTEYAAGILAVVEKAEKRLATLFALRRDEITVLPPDVNASRARTAPDPTQERTVRLGLSEIRGVGSNSQWIVAEREVNGPFTSAADLLSRVKVPGKPGKPASKLPVNAIEGLVEAGAFDSFGYSRLGLILALRGLSTGADVDVPDAEWVPLEQSARQRARLGVALGTHPMAMYHETLKAQRSFGRATPLHAVTAARSSDEGVTVLGVVAAWSEKTTRKGTKLVHFTLENEESSMDGVAFSRTLSTMRRRGHDIATGDLVAMTGRMNTRTVTTSSLNEEGEEVEETREVSELIADDIEVISVDLSPVIAMPEVEEASRVQLAEVIDIARARTAVPSARKDDPNLVDLDAPVAKVIELSEQPGRSTADASGPWNAVVRFTNGWMFCPTLDDRGVTQKWILGSPHDAGYPLARSGDSDVPQPRQIQGAREQAFVYRAGCYCTCTSCRTCPAHRTGPARDDCTCGTGCIRDCRVASRFAGWQMLLVATNTSDDETEQLIATIDPTDHAWEETEAQGWSTAPLSAVLPQALDETVHATDLTSIDDALDGDPEPKNGAAA